MTATTLLVEYRFPYGMLNSVWAAADQHNHRPDRIVVASRNPKSPLMARVHNMLSAWQEANDLPSEVIALPIDEQNVTETRTVLAQTIRDEQDAGATVAVDVTNGRTIPKLALYWAALDTEPDHIFYLDVAGYDYRDLPYPMIPRRIQRVRALDSEVLRGGP